MNEMVFRSGVVDVPGSLYFFSGLVYAVLALNGVVHDFSSLALSGFAHPCVGVGIVRL